MTASLPQPMRLREGGLINRNRPLTFTFDRRVYQGYEGDSLASALLASGVKLFGRSFKYHRPRGVFSAGPEEPSALVEIDQGKAERDPNHRAPMVELYDGLETFSQNHIGPLGLDLMEANDLISRFLPAGFYYKTFFFGGLQAWYRFYEPIIRRAAGFGRPPMEADPHHYDDLHLRRHAGGRRRDRRADHRAVAHAPGSRCWLRRARPRRRCCAVARSASTGSRARPMSTIAEIEAAGGRVLPRTTVFGSTTAGPRRAGALPRPPAKADRRAHRTHEVPLDSGRPGRLRHRRDRALRGVMGMIARGLLASAGHAYLGRYGVRVGQQPTIFTTNDGGYAVAAALAATGADVTCSMHGRIHGWRPKASACCAGSTPPRPMAAWGCTELTTAVPRAAA